MARKTAEQMSVAGNMLEEVVNAEEGALPLDERLAVLTRLRESGIENGTVIDRFLVERITRLHEALSEVREQHGELRDLISNLTAPPYFPAIFLTTANTPHVQGALVQTDNERRVVQLAEGITPEQLAPGDEVFLSHERNFVIAKSMSPGFLTGEVAAYSRSTADGRLVLRSRDEEIVVLAKSALCDAGLKIGDGIRFSRSAGLAFEKIEASKGEEFFLEATPSDTFDEVGGLDREIESLKRLITLHNFHSAAASRYRLPRKRSVLMEGPPGNGKTKVARATCNWLAGMSRSGRSRFINVKPGGLNSMWYGATEQRYREIFRIAREAAAAEPEVPVVMFWDEVDAIGGSRGESVHRIDDRMLNAFMAELNGLEDRGNIVILAATNRLDALDPALLRPGRLGDLVLHFPQPRGKAARAILGRHLPAAIPYAPCAAGSGASRDALLDQAVAQLFAQSSDTELANLTLRDGKHRLVRAADLVSGAQLESIAQAALERACVREAEGGPAGVSSADMNAAISDFFLAAPRALTSRNARNYLRDLPQDVDVVRVDLIERKVTHPHRYRVEAA
ncbi:MAG: ATP-binding protein [Terracidiphilus sp.]|jgi:proteasome-associated ATPase